jgi:hypothetical protein
LKNQSLINKNMKPVLSLLLASSLGLTACTSKQEGSGANRQPTYVKDATVDILDQNGSTIGSIQQKALSIDLQKDSIRKAQSTSLSRLFGPDSAYNANTYLVTGSSDVLVEPKLMVMPAVGDARDMSAQNDTVVVPIGMAIVDGISQTIMGADGVDGAVAVNSGLLIKNDDNQYGTESLRRFIAQKVGANAALGVLPGCPSTIAISDGINTYDVTPELFKVSDYCQVNSPFVVGLRVPKSVAQRWLKKTNSGSGSQTFTAYMQYQAEANAVVGSVHINFDRQKFFEQIQSELHAKYNFIAQADIEIAVRRVLERDRASILVVGNVNELERQIIDQSIAAFFTKMPPSPQLKAAPACASSVCFSVSYVKDQQSKTFSFDYEETAATRLPQVFESHATLQAAFLKKVMIGMDPKKAGSTQELFLNDEVSHPIADGLSRGNQFSLRILDLQIEQRDRKDEVRVYHEEHDDCAHHVFNQCDAWTHAHREIYSRSFAPLENWEVINHPMQSALNVPDQILIRFVTDSGKRQVDCPLSAFQNDGTTVFIDLENQPACQIFAGDDKKVNLFIVNTIKTSQVYWAGGREEAVNENGGYNTYSLQKYSPAVKGFVEVDLGLSMTSAE